MKMIIMLRLQEIKSIKLDYVSVKPISFDFFLNLSLSCYLEFKCGTDWGKHGENAATGNKTL